MNKPKCILGIDLVLVRSGIGIVDFETGKHIHHQAIDSKKLKGMERVDFIVNQVRSIISTYDIKEAVIEGYAMYASGRITDLAEIGGIIRYELHKNNIPFSVMAPKTMVKRITGHGGNDKDDVRKVINKKMNLDLSEDNNDESDALGLALARYIDLQNPQPIEDQEPKKKSKKRKKVA